MKLETVISLSQDVCAREPIHVPGALQPHGLLLVFDLALGRLIGKTANADEYLPPTPLGQQVAWLPPLLQQALTTPNRKPYFVTAAVSPLLSAQAHCFYEGQALFCEWEILPRQGFDLPAETLLSTLEDGIGAIAQSTNIEDLCRLTAHIIRDLSGFERVLVYGFDHDDNGDVLGESLIAHWQQSFLGLRFPASDIPPQARALYRLNHARWCPTSHYQPTSLLTVSDQSFNLTHSHFRNLSPIHLMYQRNIGVDGAMSVSVMTGDTLWGLIIGHHRHPHAVSLAVRQAVSAVTKAFALRLESLSSWDMSQEITREGHTHLTILSKLAAAEDFLAALLDGEPTIMTLLPHCTGAAVVWTHDGDNRTQTLGITPTSTELISLTGWVRQQNHSGIFATDSLPTLYPPAQAYAPIASGLLAGLFDDDRHPTLLLFRPEQQQSVTWAGKPEKLLGPDGITNLPRRSFERWTEIQHGKSLPWKPWDLEIAADVCATINSVILRQTRRIQELNRNEAILRLNEEKVRLTIHDAPIGMAMVGMDRRWLAVNPALTRITGYAQAEMLDMDVEATTHPDDIEADNDYIARLLAGECNVYEREKRYIHKNGHWVYVQVHVALVCSEIGQPLHLIAQIQDISDRKMLEQELRRSNSELEQFAYAASHDLRQPLRLISSFLDLLHKRLQGQLDDEGSLYLHTAKDGAKRMDTLILGLLQYSQVGRSRDHEFINLNHIVAEAILNLSVAIETSHGRIQTASDLPIITGNRLEMMRLFQNLIGNAIKYHAPDRPPEVHIFCRDEHAEWHIMVEDNGIGISEHDRERTFMVFQRLVTRQQYDGTGIGLAICKKIVETAQGRIWIEDAPVQGTRFVVALPKAV